MKYKCIKEMFIEKVDTNGFHISNEYGIVLVHSIWYEDDTSIIGGEIHLECESGAGDMEWIEISKDDLAENFEPVT